MVSLNWFLIIYYSECTYFDNNDESDNKVFMVTLIIASTSRIDKYCDLDAQRNRKMCHDIFFINVELVIFINFGYGLYNSIFTLI